MKLEAEILLDYGDIPQKIGSFLLKQNGSRLSDIQAALATDSETALDLTEICNGLAVLIQRRIVKFFIFEKAVRYWIDRRTLCRRLYFPLYLRWVSSNFPPEHTKYFLDVLIYGTRKESEMPPVAELLLSSGILTVDAATKGLIDHSDADTKRARPSANYLVVNYNTLDQHIFEVETCEYVHRHFNEAASEVLKALLRCDRVSHEHILQNLRSTKILLIKDGSIVNDKENICEYLKYLTQAGIITRGMDKEVTYFFNYNTVQLKRHRLNLRLTNRNYRRLFNLIMDKGPIQDSEVTLSSLMSINRVKGTLLALQRRGLVVQRCLSDYRQGSRMDHAWMVDMEYLSNSIERFLETLILDKLQKFNACWDGNYYLEERPDDGTVWLSDLISLSTDHLIFNLR